MTTRGKTGEAARWAAAVGATGAAVLVRALLDPWLGLQFPVVTLFGGVAVAVWVGGVWPALLSTVLGFLACDYFFVEPRGAFSLDDAAVVGTLGYFASCGLIVGLGHLTRSLQQSSKERSELLSVTLASIGDGVVTTDVDGRVTSLNPVAEALTGWTSAEAAGRPLEDVFRIVDEETRAPVESPARRALRDGVIVGLANHTVLVRRDGREIPIDDSAAPITDGHGRLAGCVFVFRDVTARRRAEEEVHGSEERFRALVTASAQITWTADAQGRMLDSPSWCAFTGQAASQQRGLGWLEALHPEDRERTRKVWERAVAKPALFAMEHRVRAADGEHRWMAVRAVPVLGKAGDVREWVGMDSDITDRRRAEEAQGLLAAIVTASDDAIVSKTLDGRILSWNAGAHRLYGYTAAEAVGQHIDLVIPPELRDEERTILERLSRGERVDHFETVRVGKLGQRLHVSLTISPLRDASGRIVGASKVARDITGRRQAEDELERLAGRLRLVTDAVPALISYVDAEQRYRFVNRGYVEWFGEEQDAITGRHMRDVLGEEAFARLRPHVEAALAGRRVQFEEDIPYRSGGARYVRAEYVPDVKADGSIDGFYALVTDITARRQMERALREGEERFRALADNIPQLAWMARPDGSVSWYNQRWFEYTGTTLSQVQDRGWRSVVAPEHLERVAAAYQHSIERGEPWNETVPLRGADGRYRWFLSRAFPIRDASGAITLWFGTNTDITDLLAAQEGLREADRRKDEFLATLAHELRNPLAPIHNSLEILRRTEGDGAQAGEARAIIERQVAHMVRLVDDLLDVSRITRDRLELRRDRVELASIVHHSVDSVRALAQAEAQQVEVTLPARPVFLDADPVRLAQVLSNLLNNACKYTPRGGTIRIGAEAEDGQVVVSVSDTGIGIPPEHLHVIFDMFAQVDRTLERARGGLGIGLTLVKRLVEMHGGSIEARSEGLGRGSEFVVRLPAAEGPATPRPQPVAGAEQRTAPRRRVLVVDDNRDSAESLSLLLELSGHETRAAHDGLAAVEEAGRFRPDVVLLDIGLPRLNGFDACRRIREQPWGRDVLMVALTGWGQEEDRRRSQEAGFDRHLVKPVDHAELLRLLVDLPARCGDTTGGARAAGATAEDALSGGATADGATTGGATTGGAVTGSGTTGASPADV